MVYRTDSESEARDFQGVVEAAYSDQGGRGSHVEQATQGHYRSIDWYGVVVVYIDRPIAYVISSWQITKVGTVDQRYDHDLTSCPVDS